MIKWCINCYWDDDELNPYCFDCDARNDFYKFTPKVEKKDES